MEEGGFLFTLMDSDMRLLAYYWLCLLCLKRDERQEIKGMREERFLQRFKYT